jgi:hypothetical protein
MQLLQLKLYGPQPLGSRPEVLLFDLVAGLGTEHRVNRRKTVRMLDFIIKNGR